MLWSYHVQVGACTQPVSRGKQNLPPHSDEQTSGSTSSQDSEQSKIAICDARETCLLGGVVFLQKCDQIVHKSYISFLNKQFFFAEIRIDLTCLLKSETQMMRDQEALSLSARTSKLVACLCCWSCPLAHVCAILVTGHSSDGPNRPG